MSLQENINKPRNLVLWLKIFKEIFYNKSNESYEKIVEPHTDNALAKAKILIDSKPTYVKMNSGSGAFRVNYTGDDTILKNLFIKGYRHKRLFDQAKLYKRFSVAQLSEKPGQLCISNTRIFNEIIINYLMKAIKETDSEFDKTDNIHTYEFMYTPDNDTIFIAQPIIGHKALIADDKTITTLKDLLEAYYIKLKDDIRSPYIRGKHDTNIDDIQHISVALCNALRPYLETLQKLRKKYKFVHTDLHFGNIFIKSKPDAEKKKVSIFQNALKKPIHTSLSGINTSTPNKALTTTIHEQLINDLENCVLLIADYDLARLTVKPEMFDTILQDTKFSDITEIDFKSIFIGEKAIEDQAFGINIVPKEQKRLQKKETVIRSRCAYEDYTTTYADLYKNPSNLKIADMLIYSNWDILSIFINIIAFLKKCENKLAKILGFVTYGDSIKNLYEPIVKLFQQYVINPYPVNINLNLNVIANTYKMNIEAYSNGLMEFFYACMNYMYRDKTFSNWFTFLFEGKFSFITRVFEKFKSDLNANKLGSEYISNRGGLKETQLIGKQKNKSVLQPRHIINKNPSDKTLSALSKQLQLVPVTQHDINFTTPTELQKTSKKNIEYAALNLQTHINNGPGPTTTGRVKYAEINPSAIPEYARLQTSSTSNITPVKPLSTKLQSSTKSLKLTEPGANSPPNTLLVEQQPSKNVKKSGKLKKFVKGIKNLFTKKNKKISHVIQPIETVQESNPNIRTKHDPLPKIPTTFNKTSNAIKPLPTESQTSKVKYSSNRNTFHTSHKGNKTENIKYIYTSVKRKSQRSPPSPQLLPPLPERRYSPHSQTVSQFNNTNPITSSTSRHSITNKSLTVPAANIVQKNNKLLTINERKNLFMNPKSFKKQTQTSNTKSQKKIGRLNLTRLAFFEQK